MAKAKIVVALGGNALLKKGTPPTAEAQLEVIKETVEYLAEMSYQDYELAIVHGNGPQIGNIVLASEAAEDVVPVMPFDVCGAMSQGYIGYQIQQALRMALLKRREISRLQQLLPRWWLIKTIRLLKIPQNRSVPSILKKRQTGFQRKKGMN